MKKPSALFLRTIAIIKAIPEGKVLTYGGVADFISAPGCARHVSYILSSSSKKYSLPWHRVIGSGGKVSRHIGSRRQIKMLLSENINVVDAKIDLKNYGWKPSQKEIGKLLKGIPKHKSLYSN